METLKLNCHFYRKYDKKNIEAPGKYKSTRKDE